MDKDLDVDVILNMFRHSDASQAFSPAEVIFKQDSDADKMYLVIEGVVEVGVDGRSVATLTPGNILGEMALVLKMPRAATALAKTNCKLVPIDRDKFIQIVKDYPQFALFIIKDLSKKIIELNKKVTA